MSVFCLNFSLVALGRQNNVFVACDNLDIGLLQNVGYFSDRNLFKKFTE